MPRFESAVGDPPDEELDGFTLEDGDEEDGDRDDDGDEEDDGDREDDGEEEDDDMNNLFRVSAMQRTR